MGGSPQHQQPRPIHITTASYSSSYNAAALARAAVLLLTGVVSTGGVGTVSLAASEWAEAETSAGSIGWPLSLVMADARCARPSDSEEGNFPLRLSRYLPFTEACAAAARARVLAVGDLGELYYRHPPHTQHVSVVETHTERRIYVARSPDDAKSKLQMPW